MATWRRIAVTMSAALLAAAATSAPVNDARAGGSCSINDILNGLQNTLQTIASSNCAGVTSDPALWAPVGVASGVMAGISQSQQFCQDVQNVQNQLTNVQGDGNSLVSQLNNLGIDASFLSSVLDALGSATDALSVVECACGLSNNITQVGGDLGACLADALCDLQNLAHQVDPGLFGSCSGSIVMVPTNCTQNPCQNNGACNPNLGGNVILKCPAGDDGSPVTQSPGPNGGTIVSSTLGADASGNVSVEACACPAPMTGTWITAGNYSQWSNIAQDQNCSYFMCECPTGSTLAGNSGASQYLCICQNTGQPVQPPGATEFNPDGIPCPLPLTGLPCPKGETNVDGKCVSACSSNEVLLANGTCCAPAQASSCGSCCPSGQVPDTSGACVTAPKLPQPPRTPLPGSRS
jgi:hypothetical protein